MPVVGISRVHTYIHTYIITKTSDIDIYETSQSRSSKISLSDDAYLFGIKLLNEAILPTSNVVLPVIRFKPICCYQLHFRRSCLYLHIS